FARAHGLWGAHASRVLAIASSRSRTFHVAFPAHSKAGLRKSPFRRDAETSTRDARAPQNSAFLARGSDNLLYPTSADDPRRSVRPLETEACKRPATRPIHAHSQTPAGRLANCARSYVGGSLNR